MAAHRLARIHGTEDDKVNCPFYYKIGACRHDTRCSRQHHKPTFSPTLLIKHLYPHPIRAREVYQAMISSKNSMGGVPGSMAASIASQSLQQQQQQQQQLQHPIAQLAAISATAQLDPFQSRDYFYDFVEDLHIEFSQYGKIEAIHVVDNLGDHLVGHVYVKYYDEEDASDALHAISQRTYQNTPIIVEFSPVTDFREARCRDYDDGHCARGGFCNFLHVIPIPIPLIRSLQEDEEMKRRYQHENQQQQQHRHHHQQQQQQQYGDNDRNRTNDRNRKRDRPDDEYNNDDYDQGYHQRQLDHDHSTKRSESNMGDTSRGENRPSSSNRSDSSSSSNDDDDDGGGDDNESEDEKSRDDNNNNANNNRNKDDGRRTKSSSSSSSRHHRHHRDKDRRSSSDRDRDRERSSKKHKREKR
jgi:splicing factor U2AF 35 kDa subunit